MIVNEFKASTLTIGWRAQEISETLLVRISGKRVYRDLEFEEDQKEHRAAVQQKLVSLHQDVVAIMTNSYEVFKNDGSEVGVLWSVLCGWGSPQTPQSHQTILLSFTISVSPPLPLHPAPLRLPSMCFSNILLYSWIHPTFSLLNLHSSGLRVLPFYLTSLFPSPLAGPTIFLRILFSFLLPTRFSSSGCYTRFGWTT